MSEEQAKKDNSVSSLMKDYVSTNVKDIGYNVLTDVIIPGVLDVIHQSFITFADNIFHPYGNNNSSTRYIREHKYGNRADMYHDSYKSSNPQSRDYDRQEQLKMDRIAAVHDWIFDSEGDAYSTLLYLRDRIDSSEVATVADFYDSKGVGETPKPNDWKWGWKDLSDKRGVKVVPVRTMGAIRGFQIRLPKAEAVNSK